MFFKVAEHITIEELRRCPEFAHLDSDLAQNMLDTIIEFSKIIAANELNQLENDVFETN